MKIIGSWNWAKVITPLTTSRKSGVIIPTLEVNLRYPKVEDWSIYRTNPLVLITGDGHTLAKDVKEFKSWGIPYDLYCTNRSLIFFDQQVDHWAALDVEESVWFAQYLNPKVEPNKRIHRHTIGDIVGGYDLCWEQVNDWKHEASKRFFIGNTAYFAVLTSLYMGYEKIIVAGCPLDNKPHFYESSDMVGPEWTGMMYCNWMDFKMKHKQAAQVKSMGEYSAFILGTATKDWATGGNGSG